MRKTVRFDSSVPGTTTSINIPIPKEISKTEDKAVIPSYFGSVLYQQKEEQQSLLYSLCGYDSRQKILFVSDNVDLPVKASTVNKSKGTTNKTTKKEELSKKTVFDLDKQIVRFLKYFSDFNDIKIVALDISQLGQVLSKQQVQYLGEKLWLDLDITPLLDPCFPLDSNTKETFENDLEKERLKNPRKIGSILCKGVMQRYVKEEDLVDVPRVEVEKMDIVKPSFLTTLSAYEKIFSNVEFEWLKLQAEKFKNAQGKLVFIGAQSQEGGIAKLRHAVVRLLSLLNIECRWLILKSCPEASKTIKKKFYNVLSGITCNYEEITEEEKGIYDRWVKMNAKLMKDSFQWGNIFVLDSYPPSGLVPHIKRINPEAKIVFRFHSYINKLKLKDSSSCEEETWDFIWNTSKLKECDLFVAHPVSNSMPPSVPKEKTVYRPASFDPFDGLNKDLQPEDQKYYMNILNSLLRRNQETELDLNRPYICHITRFDPSKGVHDSVYAYKIFRDELERKGVTDMKLIPQLLITGHHPQYDPQGIPILLDMRETMKIDFYSKYREDIKMLCIPRNDQLLNAVLRGSKLLLLLSHNEGMEMKISEALYHEKPVIIYRSGGMPLQVKESLNSYVETIGSTKEVAKRLFEIFTDRSLYKKLKHQTKKGIDSDFYTVASCSHWLYVGTQLLGKEKFCGNNRHIDEIMKKDGFNKYKDSVA